MPYGVGGVVEPVGLTIAVDDWAKSTRRWEAILNEKAPITDLTSDGRKRKRFFSNGIVYMDLIEAEHEVRAGDSELVLLTKDVGARVDAIRALGVPVEVDAQTGDARLSAKYASGTDIVFTARRPKIVGSEKYWKLNPLPYVFDYSVKSLKESVPIWQAILGLKGINTPEETDSGGQFKMHHFLVDGETHAIGLMQLRDDAGFIKRDSQGACHEYIMNTHGEGLLCVGFLYKGLSDLNEHISRLSDEGREQLICEAPRSYLMGENNISHPATTGGIEVIVARHYEGWTGDLNEFNDNP
jgi:hypothetical protein